MSSDARVRDGVKGQESRSQRGDGSLSTWKNEGNKEGKMKPVRRKVKKNSLKFVKNNYVLHKDRRCFRHTPPCTRPYARSSPSPGASSLLLRSRP